MSAEPLIFNRPVTLAGGGALDRQMLDEALALAPALVAADGAADRLAGWGLVPEAVIGDMDSLADPAAWHGGGARLVALDEQDTTDFEKCLYATEAPFYVGAGFTGRRLDHTLAVFHALLARPDKLVVLLGEHEAVGLLPAGRRVGVAVAPGVTVSLFPLLRSVGVASAGLEWPIEGLDMEPGRAIGTSNRAVAGRIELAFDRPGMLVMVPRRFAGGLLAGLRAAQASA